MNLRKYYGSIHFVPSLGYKAHGYAIKQVDNCTVKCQKQNGNNVPWAAESIMMAPEAKVIEFFALTMVSPGMFCPCTLYFKHVFLVGKKIHISFYGI
uniref:Uncharacterized protein n=1 Tax=Oryza rufipogon TaxID=4529 RepID=A0A0E0QWK9_ORYRU